MMLYDTAQREVVPFSPPQQVLMYVCGITPYDATHLGHASTFLTYDVVIRRLIDRGHTVRCVRNVTDVDDPLFAKARELGVHYLDLAAGEEARFNADMEALNVLPVHAAPRLVSYFRHTQIHPSGPRRRACVRQRRLGLFRCEHVRYVRRSQWLST